MRSASGAALATSSRPGSHTELSIWATPNSAAARMKALQRSNRAKHYGQSQFAAEHFNLGVDFADIAQHARAQRNRIERHAVAPQCGFRLSAADDVIPIVLIEVGARFTHDFVQVVELARRCGIGRGSGFIRIVTGHALTRDCDCWTAETAP